MIFPCDKCGICCRHIDLIPQLKQFDSGNGTCIHLTENHLCSIYAQRPDVCNVETMYKLVFSEQMSEAEYIKKNMQGCILLKREYE